MNTNLSLRGLLFGIVQASLLLAVAACTASADDGENGGTQPGGASTPTPTTPSSSGPEYRVGCGGEVTPAGLATGLAPKCVGGEPGTRCAGEADVCVAQEVSFTYVPPAVLCNATVFSWDGKACVPHQTSAAEGSLHCKGKGCASLYQDEAACKAAHAACAAR